MIPLFDIFQSAEISIVADNAKTHQPKPLEYESRRNSVKRTTSLPMDLSFGRSNRRRRTRRGSDSNVADSRWSAEADSPPKAKRDVVMSSKTFKSDSPPPCVLRNVVKPVRQDSCENFNQKSNVRLTPGRGQSLMPMMPVRQQSLRELVGCSPKGPPKVATVDLITQALEQLDSLAEDDEDVLMDSPHLSTSSLPCLPTTPF